MMLSFPALGLCILISSDDTYLLKVEMLPRENVQEKALWLSYALVWGVCLFPGGLLLAFLHQLAGLSGASGVLGNLSRKACPRGRVLVSG